MPNEVFDGWFIERITSAGWPAQGARWDALLGGYSFEEWTNFSWKKEELDLYSLPYSERSIEIIQGLSEARFGRPLTSPDELLILASIVEKETGAAEERPMIAGVFIRRLNNGMRLQTDPTVIYGIGSAYDGNIRRKDLDTDTPYNTYTRDGLPPTPIAMPGKAALEAAATPAEGDAVFFVARGDGSGRHVFSKDLNEHNAAVRQYLNNTR